jgi:transposase-like protein
MKRKKSFKAKYSPEFKVSVIMDMRENHLGYHETVRKYNLGDPESGGARKMLHRWERVYLEEGVAGLSIERRGRKTKMENSNKGRPRKKLLDKEIENDLIAENQRLRERNEYLEMELEYTKKLNALVQAEAQQNGKKRK